MKNRSEQIEVQLNRRQNTVNAVAHITTLLLACFAIYQANISNDVSERALAESRRQFLELNRPSVSLNLGRFEDQSFVKAKRDGTNLTLTLKCELKNLGNVTAKNVTFPNVISSRTLPSPSIESLLNPIALAPGAEAFATFIRAVVTYDSDSAAEDALKTWGPNGQNAVTLGLVISYTSALDPQKRYESKHRARIQRDTATILDADFP